MLLGPCSAYLDALIDMMARVVGLDLAPDSLDSTRIVDSPTCTRRQWAAVLRAGNRIPVVSYAACAEGGLSNKQTVFVRCAMGQPQVYLDHSIFPPGLTDMGLGGWEVEVERRRWQKMVDDQPPFAASGLNISHSYREVGKRERRWRIQVLVSHNETCLGLSDADRAEKRNDNFYTDLTLPNELRGVTRYISSGDYPTLYNFGPISTRSYHDGVGGWSQLVEGYKVFMWLEPQHSHILHYDTANHFFSLQAARDVVSFQWALLGPGTCPRTYHTVSYPSPHPSCLLRQQTTVLSILSSAGFHPGWPHP